MPRTIATGNTERGSPAARAAVRLARPPHTRSDAAPRDNQNVDIVRYTARDAFIARGPGSVNRYRDRVQRAEFLAGDKPGAGRECDKLGEWARVAAGRVR